MSKTLHITTPQETILPVTYIEKYSIPTVKETVHRYKFQKDTSDKFFEAQKALTDVLIDLCIGIITSICKPENTIIFTSPPSTMFARREKSTDSMWTLLTHTCSDLPFYTVISSKTYVLYLKMFTVRAAFLKKQRALHIESSRKTRISNMHGRYSVSLYFKIRLFFILQIKKQKKFSFCIIDDVASTGGTLLACSETLRTYMCDIQKKKPEISFDIQVFSLVH